MSHQKRRDRPAGNGPADTSNTTDQIVGEARDVEAAVRTEVLAQMRETIRQIRAAQAAQDAERQLSPATGCICGCASEPDYADPECARFVRDHGAAYRDRVGRLRAVEGRSMPECASPGIVLCLLAGNTAEFVAELFGITVADAQLVRDAIPARCWDEEDE